jgi:large subunit ribosomal protein L22
MKISQVYAKHKSARISPKKVAPVMDLIRGKDLKEAKIILALDLTKASDLIAKVLNSAEANARNNLDLKAVDLYISEAKVDGGRTMKRGRIIARSRLNPILKRTSHITLGLSEKEAVVKERALKEKKAKQEAKEVKPAVKNAKEEKGKKSAPKKTGNKKPVKSKKVKSEEK